MRLRRAAVPDATTEDQVDDPAVLSDTAEHLASARTHLSTKPADAEAQPHWLLEIPGLRVDRPGGDHADKPC